MNMNKELRKKIEEITSEVFTETPDNAYMDSLREETVTKLVALFEERVRDQWKKDFKSAMEKPTECVCLCHDWTIGGEKVHLKSCNHRSYTEPTKLLTKKGTRSLKDTMKIVKKVAEREPTECKLEHQHNFFCKEDPEGYREEYMSVEPTQKDDTENKDSVIQNKSIYNDDTQKVEKIKPLTSHDFVWEFQPSEEIKNLEVLQDKINELVENVNLLNSKCLKKNT